MTALAKDRATPYRNGVEIEFPVKNGVQIYAGALVMLGSDGYAIPGADTSGAKFVGVALENVAGGASDGLKTVRVRREGVFDFAATNMNQAQVGDVMYLVDDQTFSNVGTTTNDIPCGRLVKYVSATRGWIDIGNCWIS
jgi:hypothetical protein